ncbi:hypothetical protein [Leptospira licerasiae]|uniref:Lipoprotein n=1 Tax=Leptospira licerasiae str. MMD4847 TaxID=1049971 RepID=A0ABN0H696_9LEPT|nr:hypothetical protein [Leptospira licerasiae]EIE03178.1 hypothetical protein LEP1GSC185_2286 [Leptospira licerasiae serovar Varillal str. VAR 010]EJZ40977.1 hypothetical protein LEP1GSC178_1560 [Leptospira licerasiae str. MMD4847]
MKRYLSFGHFAALVLVYSSFLNCFTVFPYKQETVDSRLLDRKEEVIISNRGKIDYEFQNFELVLKIEGASFRETLEKRKTLETKIVHYDYKKTDGYRQLDTDDKPWNRYILGMFADIGALLEWTTIPFRTISKKREEETLTENIIKSEKVKTFEPKELQLILRAENTEFFDKSPSSDSIRIPLTEIRKFFPKTNFVEALLYYGKERIEYQNIPVAEEIRKMKLR